MISSKSALIITTIVLVCSALGYYLVQMSREETRRELVIWAGLERDEMESLEEIVRDFETETGMSAKVEWEADIKLLREKYRIATPAGKGPAILLGPHDWIGEFAEAGFILTLSEKVFPADERAKFLDTAMEAITYRGEVYGFPCLMEAIVLIYNKDYISEPPATWDELIQQAKELTDETANFWGFYYAHTDPYYSFPIMSGYGAYIFGGDENVENIGLATQGAIEGAKLIQDMVHEHEILPLDPKLNPYVVRDIFLAEKAAVIIDGPWAFARFAEKGIDYGVAKLPTLPNGQQPRAFVGVQTCMINPYFENIDAALKLAVYLSSSQSQLRLHEAGWRIPTRVEMLELPEVSRKQEVVTVLSQAENGILMPKAPEMVVVWTPWKSALELIIQGQNPEETLPDAVAVMHNEIEKMK